MMSKFISAARYLFDVVWPTPSEHEVELYLTAQDQPWDAASGAPRDAQRAQAAAKASDDGMGGLSLY